MSETTVPDETSHAARVMSRLPLNTPHRFYRGGERILAFRGLEVPPDFDGHRPEDWLASTTRLFAEGGDGVTVLDDGTRLPDALAADPEHWLGAAHLAAHGVEPGLLTKLLDAGERLPVHSHPDRTFAAAHLDCAHGKTEAWIVLDAAPGACVWLGFRDELPADELADLVEAQDHRLLTALNRIEVSAGDALLVPGGQPHAIGEGVFVLELQEPTDLSVMLEHRRFGLEQAHAFLGLDIPRALESVDRGPLTAEGLTALRRRWTDVGGTGHALPEDAAEFFRAEVLRARPDAPATGAAAFAVAVVVEGHGTLTTGTGPPRTTEVGRGDVLLVPHGAGDVRLEGELTVIRCMPSA
ncbi:class I mannose-6-phosphate isomerase [Terrabacter aerolatus]|uniref:Mannose-6-phosphate isomerase n=1 Tax=Terrabacter aerolatus TaxID=422442 RepID=A0A512CZW3_9MICO|nr:class I mannose-6-phosphate isomerase [Terrabacter aerolatus]GEO29550.1 mannose-6-phosphate isomerase [Terrabacter aerolatus]